MPRVPDVSEFHAPTDDEEAYGNMNENMDNTDKEGTESIGSNVNDNDEDAEDKGVDDNIHNNLNENVYGNLNENYDDKNRKDVNDSERNNGEDNVEDEIQNRIMERRRRQKSKTNQNIMSDALGDIAQDQEREKQWVPGPADLVHLTIGIQFESRWQCEYLIRCRTSAQGIQEGISVQKTYEKVAAACKRGGMQLQSSFRPPAEHGLLETEQICRAPRQMFC